MNNLFEHALVNTLKEALGPSAQVTLTDNRRTFLSIVRGKSGVHARISRLFSMADQTTIHSLAQFLRGETKKLPLTVRKFIDTQSLPQEARKKALKGLRTAGEVYDLKDLAESVNRRLFNGELSCKIAWGDIPSRKTRRRGGSIMLGSYDKDLDLIRIHPALDNTDAPRFFVEHVIYHELLHKKLGVARDEEGRRRPHGAEFRRMERLDENHPVAREWEKKNISLIFKVRRKLIKRQDAARRGN
ncbi:MAG: hypothetical protein HY751_06770 [Nitrospinae bacterium]|nr:hypothetical protein [Nitrospinota bacterium]